jgi:PadR family transcriptional regulator, regulatory protein PadR
MNLLGHFEQTLLLALAAGEDEATGLSIAAHLEEQTGRRPSPGAVYTALNRLETRGLVRSRLGDPLPQRGGKARRHYKLTAAGLASARKVHAAMTNLAGSLPLKQKP